jgi:uncharacterized damage-inducible protein DinB
MNAKDGLKTQYHFFYLTAKRNLEGLSAEDSVVQPSPGGNCANWILGHMVGAHNAVMGLVNQAPVWESEDLARAATEPITSAAEAIDWGTMVSKLLDSESRFMAGLDALSEEALDDEGFTDPFGNEVTRGEMLNLMAVHQNYHAGQLGLSRRLAGHPGAIRPPAAQAKEVSA